jgi:hypothetical protein
MPMWKASKTRQGEPAARSMGCAYLPSKYPRINSLLRSLEAHTQTITAPPPRHYR